MAFKMKTLLLFFSLTLSCEFFAQNNLQFNSAVFNSINGLANQQTIGTIVVPANKVLKIEYASVSVISNSAGTIPPTISNMGQIQAFVNNMVVFSNYEVTVSYPIWLPSGTYPVTVYNGNYPSYTHSFSYSGILFDLVP